MSDFQLKLVVGFFSTIGLKLTKKSHMNFHADFEKEIVNFFKQLISEKCVFCKNVNSVKMWIL